MASTFANKRVFITGGSSGIGRALAWQLAAEGAHVCIAARGQAGIDETIAELEARAASPTQILFGVAVDIGDREAVGAAVGRVLERLGGLDLLINNAGIAHPAAFLDTPDEVFDAMMRVNYFGTVHVTRALVPAMIEGGGGQVAIVSSLAGVVGIYGYTAYAASKYAVRGFAECLRQELMQHGIGVSVVFPPDTDTPQLERESRTKPPETAALAGTVKPLSAEFVAKTILAGLSRRRFHVIPGLASKLIYFAAGRFPVITRLVLDRDLRRFQRRARALARGDE
ncbi:Fatty acyl-CoA reductase [Enhygromyxa salina]|uniref:3-dehydrosphinganine reductase n=1 Tax=Enhygromyxa salina TaxID=215803 RepID=A0A2S9XCV1_9BACT|nr:SDR family oxidoreductase [Enhygromyxa salina]PRP90692.1 Fatty acyl-CoA reductase [Enhygromyxa salina]